MQHLGCGSLSKLRTPGRLRPFLAWASVRSLSPADGSGPLVRGRGRGVGDWLGESGGGSAMYTPERDRKRTVLGCVLLRVAVSEGRSGGRSGRSMPAGKALSKGEKGGRPTSSRTSAAWTGACMERRMRDSGSTYDVTLSD